MQTRMFGHFQPAAKCVILEELNAGLDNLEAYIFTHPDLDIEKATWDLIHKITGRERPATFLRSTDWKHAGRI